MKRYQLCFVDDDPTEIERARKFLGKRFKIGGGHSIDQALEDLHQHGGRKPDLFLLDMYFPEGRAPTETELSELQKAREMFLAAYAKFAAILAQLGQTSDGGFSLARELRRRTTTPFVFFTRKGTLKDTVRAYEESAAAMVINKPDPAPREPQRSGLQEAYDAAFEKEADNVARKIETAIHRSTWWSRRSKLVYSFVGGVVVHWVATALWQVGGQWFK